MKIELCCLLVFLVAFSLQQNSTESLSVYAAPQGSPAPNCGSLSQPCAGLAQAVQAATLLQTNLTLSTTTIYALPGTYSLNDTLLVNSPISFRSVNGSSQTLITATSTQTWQFDFSVEDELTIEVSGFTLSQVGIVWSEPDEIRSQYNLTLGDLRYNQTEGVLLTLMRLSPVVGSVVVDGLVIEDTRVNNYLVGSELSAVTMRNVMVLGGETFGPSFLFTRPIPFSSSEVQLNLRWENWVVQGYVSYNQRFLITTQRGTTHLQNVTFGGTDHGPGVHTRASTFILSSAPLVVESCAFVSVECDQIIVAYQTLTMVETVISRVSGVLSDNALITIASAQKGSNSIRNCAFQALSCFKSRVFELTPTNPIEFVGNQWSRIIADALFRAVVSSNSYSLHVVDNHFEEIIAPRLFFIGATNSKGGPFSFRNNTFAHIEAGDEFPFSVTQSDGIISMPRFSEYAPLAPPPFIMENCTVSNSEIPILYLNGLNVTLSSNNFERYMSSLSMAVVEKSQLAITDTSFSSCWSSQLLNVSESTIQMNGVQFVNNVMPEDVPSGESDPTGTLVDISGSTFDITDTQFHNNTVYDAVLQMRANSAGAMQLVNVSSNLGAGASSSIILVEDSVLSATNLDCKDNMATSGGALAIRGASNVTAKDSRFTRNIAQAGGAIYLDGPPSATFAGCEFEGNYGSTGGAIWISGNGTTDLNDSQFQHMRSDESGGALHIRGSATLTSSNVHIVNCTSPLGGGIFVGGRAQVTFDQLHVDTCNGLVAGGGLYIYDSTLAQITNSQVERCTSGTGSAIYAGSTSITTMTSVEISDNMALYEGAGLYLAEYAVLTLADSQVSNNAAQSNGGGALVSGYSSLTCTGSQFNSNACESKGGGIAGFNRAQIKIRNGTEIYSNTAAEGGALYLTDVSEFELSDAHVHDNSAMRGGALHLTVSASGTITSSPIENNHASSGPGGGAILLDSSAVQIKDTLFHGNDAAYGGGLHIFSEASMNFDGVVFEKNHAADSGGAILSGEGARIYCSQCHFQNNTASTGNGGGVHLQDQSFFNASSCMFQANVAVSGGALFVEKGALMEGNSNLYYFNEATFGGAVCVSPSGQLNETYSLIVNNTASQSGGGVNLAGSQASLYEVLIKDNAAKVGGGLSLTFSSHSGTPALSKVSIQDNVAELGGGVALLASTLTLPGLPGNKMDNEISGVIITKNVANQGGGIYVDRLLDNGPVLGPDITVHSNIATEMGGGIAFDVYNTGFVLIKDGTFTDNAAYWAGSNAAFNHIKSPDEAADFCQNCFFKQPTHADLSYQTDQGFATTPSTLGYVNPCPNLLSVEADPITLEVGLFDQFGTLVMGDYLQSFPVQVTMGGHGNATLNNPDSVLAINETTGLAIFSNLTFCGDNNSVSTISVQASINQVQSARCNVLLYGCPSGQQVVSPSSKVGCATCQAESPNAPTGPAPPSGNPPTTPAGDCSSTTWMWVALVCIAIIIAMSFLTGFLVIYRLWQLKSHLKFESEFPDFASQSLLDGSF